MTKKSFFMCMMTANLQGRALASFNTVNAINTRNITAADIGRIQDGGAAMCRQANIEFDDIVIQNIFYLGEMTEEEFRAGTPLDPEFRNAQNTALAEAMSREMAQAQAHNEVPSDVQHEPANQVLNPRAELVVDNTADQAEVAAQAVEETPADAVTSADVVGEEQPFAEGDDKPAA